MVGVSTHHHCSRMGDRYTTTTTIYSNHATRCSVAMLPVAIAISEGLQNAQDMESLGIVLGIQLRHTNAQSPLDFTSHEN